MSSLKEPEITCEECGKRIDEGDRAVRIGFLEIDYISFQEGIVDTTSYSYFDEPEFYHPDCWGDSDAGT